MKISDPENGRFLQPESAGWPTIKSGRFLFHFLTRDIAADARHSFDPRPVVGHPHVDARHVRVGAADAVRNGSDQRPATVVTFHHQRTATVALCAADEPTK